MAVDETAIRERAYVLWEQHGRPEGRDLEFWLFAEAQLTGDAVDTGLEDTFPASDPPASIMRS